MRNIATPRSPREIALFPIRSMSPTRPIDSITIPLLLRPPTPPKLAILSKKQAFQDLFHPGPRHPTDLSPFLKPACDLRPIINFNLTALLSPTLRHTHTPEEKERKKTETHAAADTQAPRPLHHMHRHHHKKQVKSINNHAQRTKHGEGSTRKLWAEKEGR